MPFAKRTNTPLKAIVVSSLVLSGCVESASQGSGLVAAPTAPLSTEEQELRNLEQQRLNTATTIGALSGAAVGAIIAESQDMDEMERFAATLIGGLLGAAAGRATGQYVNTRARAFATEQDRARAFIASADQDIATYSRVNRTASRLVDQQKKKIADLNSQLQSGAITEAEYRGQIRSAKANLATLNNQVEAVQKQIDVMRDDIEVVRRSTGNAAGLERRVAQLEKQKRTMEQLRDGLQDVYDQVPAPVGRPTL